MVAGGVGEVKGLLTRRCVPRYLAAHILTTVEGFMRLTVASNDTTVEVRVDVDGDGDVEILARSTDVEELWTPIGWITQAGMFKPAFIDGEWADRLGFRRDDAGYLEVD